MRLRLVITSLATLALLVYAGAGGDLVLVAHSQETGGPAASVADPRALVNDYCAYCHDDSLKEGGFSWSEVDVANPHQNAEQAEKVIRKLRSGMMPPAGQPRPDRSSLSERASAIETAIDKAAAEADVKSMCEKLLANPVIETFIYELEPA